jgi:cyclic beta-1,2-glucan synthetase
MVVVSLFLTVLLGVVLDNILVTVLLLFPIWAMVKNVFDFIIAKHIPPVWLPRLELKKGIPAEGKTLCVISILLTSRESAKQAARLLEEFSITNRDAGSNLNFGSLPTSGKRMQGPLRRTGRSSISPPVRFRD